MKIAIIGGGLTGLTAAFELSKHGHAVTVFEKEKTPGGLAGGFGKKNWKWSLEYSYHHFFTNDQRLLSFIKELGLEKGIMIRRPLTATYEHGGIYFLDTPLNLLSYPHLSPLDKFRTGLFLTALKLNPLWQPLEYVTAYDFFRFMGGKHAWDILWEPLMTGKFGALSRTVPASWLWARIKKRTPRLGYIGEGFNALVTLLEKTISHQGGEILTDTAVISILPESAGDGPVSERARSASLRIDYSVKSRRASGIRHSAFDRILLTVPTQIATKLVHHSSFIIPHSAYSVPHLHAQTLILETIEPILKDVYWLNIADRNFPFLAVVAHTNFMDKKYYGNHHITYFGNYLPEGHTYLSMTKEQILKIFLPYIQRLSPNNKFQILHSYLSTAPYAQPVHQLRYSKIAPKLQTAIPGVYLANLDSIYPWDRGTNYAVELGKRAALKIMRDAKESL